MKIAVASGKGGTGKTLVATNLFNILQQQGSMVELVDCDAEEPNDRQFIKGKLMDEEIVTQNIPSIDKDICTFCGKCQTYCNYNAIIVLPEQKHIQVIEELCHDCGACCYACKTGAIIEETKPIGSVTTYKTDKGCFLLEGQIDIGIYSPVPVINKVIKSTQMDELVIFDSPPGTSCPFIATVSAAEFVILVSEPTPFGLNDLRLSVETLIQLKKPFGVVINRSGLGDEKMYQFLNEKRIPLLAQIPFDRQVAQQYSDGKLITDTMPEYQERFQQLLGCLNKQIKND
ncbi:nucleotide-binding protein [Sunxiuqinia sp. A32]|uniref:nucleotide-binding protein n=1 Tax=Sunxiuqinia sp. A32 TaxID=3461496 RepID=UPI004045DA1F